MQQFGLGYLLLTLVNNLLLRHYSGYYVASHMELQWRLYCFVLDINLHKKANSVNPEAPLTVQLSNGTAVLAGQYITMAASYSTEFFAEWVMVTCSILMAHVSVYPFRMVLGTYLCKIIIATPSAVSFFVLCSSSVHHSPLSC